ncbi:hypothetical protein L596_013054 [Steinernema carpocapsae]|uniref:Uncharacterized protein n=1 Tax=Steinernema carpocapsae TaxID=34508 RepID=A0A4U5NYZ8_STECR|nr:hypothetical protein L596_013054 [Steinernema carpocapsae]
MRRRRNSMSNGGDRKPKLDDRKRKYPQVELEELMTNAQEQVKTAESTNKSANHKRRNCKFWEAGFGIRSHTRSKLKVDAESIVSSTTSDFEE